MIVNCPSCATLYRCDTTADGLAVLAHCSKCDARFDVAPTTRAYAIVAETDAAINRAIGGAQPSRGGAEQWNPPDGMKLGTFDYEPDAAAAPDAVAVAPSRKSTLGEWFTAMFLGGVGGGSGYYLSVLQEADMATCVAGGSAIGLVIGWAVIRWMAREP